MLHYWDIVLLLDDALISCRYIANFVFNVAVFDIALFDVALVNVELFRYCNLDVPLFNVVLF